MGTRSRRTEQQIREDMENLSTEVALGRGIKGAIDNLFRESLDNTDEPFGFRGQLLTNMQHAMEQALKPYPTGEDTAELHDEYREIKDKVSDLDDKLDTTIEAVEKIGAFFEFNVDYRSNGESYWEKHTEVVSEQIQELGKNIGDAIVEQLATSLTEKLSSVVDDKVEEQLETPEQKLARLERENKYYRENL
jgi:tetrahydromethanopterin S-methyltransferase subunit G